MSKKRTWALAITMLLLIPIALAFHFWPLLEPARDYSAEFTAMLIFAGTAIYVLAIVKPHDNNILPITALLAPAIAIVLPAALTLSSNTDALISLAVISPLGVPILFKLISPTPAQESSQPQE